MKPKEISGVPRHEKGGFHDTESTAKTSAKLVDAKFEILKQRFLDVNSWKENSAVGASEFKLFSKNGQPANRRPEIGDKIRINIPGPGGIQTDSYDWVDVIDYRETKNADEGTFSIVMTCRPAHPPRQENEENIAHFYGEDATSTFMITKGKDYVMASVHGRNEKPNTKKAGWLDAVRNFFIGSGGILGAGKAQWKLLTEGLISGLEDADK